MQILDDPARYLNTALFLRMLCEITATVLVAQVVLSASTDQPGRFAQ